MDRSLYFFLFVLLLAPYETKKERNAAIAILFLIWFCQRSAVNHCTHRPDSYWCCVVSN